MYLVYSVNVSQLIYWYFPCLIFIPFLHQQNLIHYVCISFVFSWKISSILAAFLASFLWRMILNAILAGLLHTSECSCVLVDSESSEYQSNQVLRYTYGLSPCTAFSVSQGEGGGGKVCCWIEAIYQPVGQWQHYQFIFCNSNCQNTF